MTDENLLLEQWKATRSMAVANALQRIASEDWLERTKKLARLNIDEARAQVPSLFSLDDPRLTVFLVDALFAARWPSSGAQGLWRKIFATLVALRDRRAIEPLRQAAKTPPHFIGLAHTKWMVARLEETASGLEKACAALPPEEVPPDEVFTRPKSKQVSGDAAQLVAAVWAQPDDDAIRLVAADGLMELGDPWGEFITLQFRIAQRKAKPAERKRADGLIHKYGVRFGGPIAAICTKDAWTFEKGFLVKCAADRSMVPRRRWDEALEAPHWATVQTLKLDSNTPQWWLKALVAKPTIRSLRTIDVFTHSLVRDSAASPWRLSKPKKKPTLIELAYLRAVAKSVGLEGLPP